MWGVRGRALSHARPYILWGVRPGPATNWPWLRWVRAWEPVTNLRARALASWLARCGGGARVPGGRLLPGCGASGVGRSPTPDRPSFGACGRGPLPTGCGCGGCGRGDPSPTPQRALWRAGFARCGSSTRAPGGGRTCLGVGRPGSGALPPPTARPLGRAAGARYPLAVGAGGVGWGSVTNRTARALACWLCALWERHKGARGGPYLPGCGAAGVGCSPTPDRPCFGGCGRGPLPTGCGCGGCGRGDSSLTPQRALLRAGFARCGGGRRAPGGGRLLPGCRASGVGRPPIPDRPSFRAWGRGPLPTGCGCGGCGRGDPSPTPQRALLRAGFARCESGTRAPGGGASCLSVGRPGSGALPPPTARPLGRAAGARYPPAVGAGGVGWGSVTNSTARALVSWLCALWRGQEGAPAGAPLACMWGVRDWALSHPRPPMLWGVWLFPLPTGCRCGGGGRGDPSPTPPRALLRAGFARCGGGTRAPGGGASCLSVGRPGSNALPSPTARALGRAAGAHYQPAAGAGGAGVGTRHQLHSARSCELALRAVGVARGRPGGPPLAWVWGVPGQTLSRPRPPVLCGVRPGPTTHWLRVPGKRALGFVSNSTARALARWLCSLSGRHEDARGDALCLGVGRPGLGGLPPPTTRPSRCAAKAHYPLAVAAGELGVGTHHQPHSARSGVLALRALGAAQARPGGCLLAGCGASGVGRSPTPDRPSFWACGRGPLPTGCGCGGCVLGNPSPIPQRALLRAGFARCGGSTRALGGRRLLPGCGASGVGRSPTPDRPCFGACGWDPLPSGCGCGGCGRGDCHQPHRAHSCVLDLRAVGAARGCPGEGASCLDVGRPGLGALPPPTARPLERAAWAHYPLAVGAGGVGVGTRHQPHSARSRKLALRAVGAARRRPGGGLLAWVWGVRVQALSRPRQPVLWGAAGVHYPLPVGAQGAGVQTLDNSVARALASWHCAPWG